MAAPMSATTVSPCPFRGVTATASAACPCSVRANGRVHRLSLDTSRPRSRREPIVSQYLNWPGNVRNAATTRLRHFPRESLIACLSSGEASIVKVEVAGHMGKTTAKNSTCRPESFDKLGHSVFNWRSSEANMSRAPYISKSKYLSGLQCPKLLWSAYNAKHLFPAR